MRPGRNMQIKQIKRSDSLVLILICCSSIALVTSRASTAYQNSANFQPQQNNSQNSGRVQTKPLPAPARWLGLIGEYGPDNDILLILEKDGKLCALFRRVEFQSLDEISRNVFRFPAQGAYANQRLIFRLDARGRATQAEIMPNLWASRQPSARDVLLASTILKRRQIEPESGHQLR